MKDETDKSFYDSPKWRRKRNAILRRDHYQCQLCKRFGRITPAKLVHHKLELSEYPELAFDDDNLVSVCQACHNKLHDEKGTKSLYKRRLDQGEDHYSGERL